MIDVDFERVRAVFLAARDLDPVRRAHLLQQERENNPAIGSEIESLLDHYDAQQAKATTPVVAGALQAVFESWPLIEEQLPRLFGSFELLEIIGRGGMGTVYRARQRTPDRTVALKVIRPGMMSTMMLERFRYEADILARLQHPGIAQIYEAGAVTAHDGQQPYFAMELVTGQPIDEYVFERSLDVQERLQLMMNVCAAVHHAHQKGVIHRDLKPANILVDSTGQPRVLDFGVACATDADLRTTTLRTLEGQLIGTLPYMSPEQVSGDLHRLDVRSDVYALGVLLFEIMTGRLPHDLRDKSVADAALTIRDDAPQRLGAIEPALRGDLETITGKALEKDPSRRYDSAAQLAEDVRRYLGHQPIIARPPSMVYQLRLFTRRHRALVSACALGLAALLIASAVSLAFAIHSQRAAASEARQRLVADRTNELLDDMLTMPDPHRRGPQLTVSEMLLAMVERLDAEEEIPEVEARVRTTLGRTFVQQRQAERAVEQLQRAVELWRQIEPDGRELAEALVPLGVARLHVGDRDGSEAAYLEAIGILDRFAEASRVAARGGLLDALLRAQKFEEADPIARWLLEIARQDNDTVMLIARLRQVAKIESGLGRRDEADHDLVEARHLAAIHLPETHPMHIGILLDLCNVRRANGDLVGALNATTEAYHLATRVGRPGSFDWMASIHTHMEVLRALDRRDELIALLTDARAALISTSGADQSFVKEIDAMLLRLAEGEVEAER